MYNVFENYLVENFQLRLDFLNFVITGPSTRTSSVTKLLNGESSGAAAAVPTASDATQCLTDQFTVTTSSSVIPVLCGTLTGDHSKCLPYSIKHAVLSK